MQNFLHFFFFSFFVSFPNQTENNSAQHHGELSQQTGYTQLGGSVDQGISSFKTRKKMPNQPFLPVIPSLREELAAAGEGDVVQCAGGPSHQRGRYQLQANPADDGPILHGENFLHQGPIEGV